MEVNCTKDRVSPFRLRCGTSVRQRRLRRRGAKASILINSRKIDTDDKASYLQEMARYYYRADRPESQSLQIAAHKGNRLLLKPPSGVTVAQLTIISQGGWNASPSGSSGLTTMGNSMSRSRTFSRASPLARRPANSSRPSMRSPRPLASSASGLIRSGKRVPTICGLSTRNNICFGNASEVDVKRSDIDKRKRNK